VKEYKKRVQTVFVIWSILNTERMLGALVRYFEYRGKDWEDFIISKIRGF